MKAKRDEQHLNRLARILLEEIGDQGFALIFFDRSRFSAKPVDFLSNVKRRSLVAAMKEFIAREEATYHQEPHHKQ